MPDQHATAILNVEPPLAIAIDIGSSSIRTMAFDRRGRQIDSATSQRAYDLDTSVAGQVTIDADRIVDIVCLRLDATLSKLAADLPIAAVGISSFWHSLLGLDRTFRPATPVYHLADNRSAAIVDRLRSSLDEQHWQSITGTVFHSSYWPAKLRWLRELYPDQFSATETWTSAADYLTARLTGSASTSLCMASGTGLCEVASARWSEELAGHAGVRVADLASIVDRDVPSFLLPEFASRWPRLKGVPWFPPLGDGACANVGAGSINRKRVALTLGTTGATRVIDHSPVGHAVDSLPGLWTYRLDADSIVRGAAITNGGSWFEFISELLADHDGALLDEAFELPPGAHGLTVLPFLAGERAPIWNDRARSVIAGLSPGTTRADLVRASLEAVAHRLALIYEDTGTAANPEHQIVANGAALLRSSGLQQMVADSLGRPIMTLSPHLEASARGAALCALESAGLISGLADCDDVAAQATIVSPRPERTDRYRAERQRQELLRQLLYPALTSWDLETHG